MRKSTLVLIIVCTIYTPQAGAQDKTWDTVSIPGICTFQIPPTLEIQKGIYKQIKEKHQRKVLEITSSPDDVVAQPKGINSFDPEALKRYCRVIVETHRGHPGDFQSLDAPLAFSKEELRETDAMLKKQAQKAVAFTKAKGFRSKLLSWQPAEIVRVNGVYALKTTYSRSLKDAPPVIVNRYMIQNNDCTHIITISYRISEKAIWEADLSKVINTFKFKKRLAVSRALAAQKKPLKDVGTDAWGDTQVSLKGAGEDHVAAAWWIPNEFWESILARDTMTTEADKKAMIDALSGVSLLAVVQADITLLGAFKFYSKEEKEKKLVVSYTDTDGNKLILSTMQRINPVLKDVLGEVKPIFRAAFGNLGNNMHFFVFNDKSKSSLRLIDPYRAGIMHIKLGKRNGDLMTAEIEMPLNCLFVPRKCPNGKDAHISWKYCPWTGKRLGN